MDQPKVIFTKRELRQLLFLIVFGLFIIVFQVFQFVNTRNAQNAYQSVIDKKNKLIISVNSILLESSVLQRSLLNLNMAMSVDSVEAVTMNQRISDSEKKIEDHIANIKSVTEMDSKDLAIFLDKLKDDYVVYKANFQYFLKIIKDDNKEVISDFRKSELRNSLDAFQKSQMNFFELLIKHENLEFENVSKRTNNLGWKYLLAGNAVLFIILVLLSYILLTERKNS